MVRYSTLAASNMQAPFLDPAPTERPAPWRDEAAQRPYPQDWHRRFVAGGGLSLLVRPMHADDEARMIAFHTELSEQTVHWRYFRTMPLQTRIAHDRLAAICTPDPGHEAVLVAEWTDPVGQRRIVGVGRLVDLPRGGVAEFAVLVSDVWQGRGVGRQLLGELVEMAKVAGRRRLVGDIMCDNTHMQRMVQALGFNLTFDIDDRVMKATLHLEDATPPA